VGTRRKWMTSLIPRKSEPKGKFRWTGGIRNLRQKEEKEGKRTRPMHDLPARKKKRRNCHRDRLKEGNVKGRLLSSASAKSRTGGGGGYQSKKNEQESTVSEERENKKTVLRALESGKSKGGGGGKKSDRKSARSTREGGEKDPDAFATRKNQSKKDLSGRQPRARLAGEKKLGKERDG